MATLAVIGLLVSLAGLISIYVGAFRAHVTWGLFMLLAAPVVLPVFAVRHWRLVRVGLLLLVAGIVSVSYASYSAGTWPPHQYLLSLTKPENLGVLGRAMLGRKQPAEEPATEQAPGDGQPPATEAVPQQQDQAPQQPAREAQVSQPQRTPPPEVLARLAERQQQSSARYVEFSIEDLPAYFGYRVRVTEIDNKVHDVLLKDQDGSQLVFEKQFASGGAVEFRLESRNILKLEALQP